MPKEKVEHLLNALDDAGHACAYITQLGGDAESRAFFKVLAIQVKAFERQVIEEAVRIGLVTVPA